MPLSDPSSPFPSQSQRRRLFATATLVVAVVWSLGAVLIYKHVGTLALARTFDAYLGEMSAGPAPGSQPAALFDPLSMFLNPFGSPAASQPTGPQQDGAERQARTKRAAEAAIAVGKWTEGVRTGWLVMMAAVLLVMLVTAAAGLCGSSKSERLHRALGWLMIAATLGTFVAIGLLIEKAGFPSMPSGVYVLIALLQSGYGWILLFTQPAGAFGPPEA